jgi:hypothetical protein
LFVLCMSSNFTVGTFFFRLYLVRRCAMASM